MSHYPLDQFYTLPTTAETCYATLLAHLPRPLVKTAYFIDPAAGDGVFYRLLPAGRRIGLDVAPAHPNIKQANFFTWQPQGGGKATRIIISNPPFGKRGKLALQFLCHAATIADTIAFIVPMCFRKHAIQSKLPTDLRLLCQHDLPRDAFRLPNGKPYAVKTEFQIWSRRRDLAGSDQRRLTPEPICHADFAMHQYNNTKQALVVFERDFDFAVPCQGWQDYSRRETSAKACEKNKQWMLFKANTQRAHRKLHALDYGKLAMQATAIPGFRKRDVVEAYGRIG